MSVAAVGQMQSGPHTAVIFGGAGGNICIGQPAGAAGYPKAAGACCGLGEGSD